MALSPGAVPQQSHLPPSGHSEFKGPGEREMSPYISELCLLALVVTIGGRLKRLLLWHSGKEGKVKHSFEAIQRNQAAPGHSWTTEEIVSHLLEGSSSDHSPTLKGLATRAYRISSHHSCFILALWTGMKLTFVKFDSMWESCFKTEVKHPDI